MRKNRDAEMDILGQIWDTKPKTGQMGVHGELRLFPGHVVKNRDCSGKSGTDGHLSRNRV